MTSSLRDPGVPWMLRLFSVTGIAPLTAFFALHLWLNARATQGRRAYEAWARALYDLPLRPLLEMLFVALPLAFHAIYGVLALLERVPSPAEPPYTHPWSRSMQRATGVAAFVFVGAHVLVIRLPLLTGELVPADLHPTLVERLSSTAALGVPVAAAGYLLGLAACAYHLANGVCRYCLRAGIGKTARARTMLSASCTLVGSALFFVGANTVVYFATGAPLAGSPAESGRSRSQTILSPEANAAVLPPSFV